MRPSVLARGRGDKRDWRVYGARREGGQRIAELGLFRRVTALVAVVEVDEAAVGIEVLERMQQRALPDGKERDSQEDPR